MLSQVLTRKEQLVLLFLGGSICLGSIVLYSVSSPSDADPDGDTPESLEPSIRPAPVATEPATVAPTPRPETKEIKVSVAGAIRQPGLYKFKEGARVQDAIDSGGGEQEWSDLSDINLAARLIDGTTLTIPGEPDRQPDTIRRPSLPPPNPPQYTVSGWRKESLQQSTMPLLASDEAASSLIDLNRATSAELETLPGIGPKLAVEIIRFRSQQPFQTVEDLDLVSGIGPKKLEAIRELVVVHP